MAWVDQLNYAGYDDWRLPSTDETVINPDGGFGYEGPDQNGEYDYRDGFNMVNSEMGYLYYETLENKGLYDTIGNNPQPGWGLQNSDPFINLQANDYWSSTEHAPLFVDAWYFQFNNGFQNLSSKDGNRQFAWAVLDGDVVAHVHCVSTEAELLTALTISTVNSTDDIITIQQGTYNGNFVYASTEPYGVTIEGGYTVGCASRVVDPFSGHYLRLPKLTSKTC